MCWLAQYKQIFNSGICIANLELSRSVDSWLEHPNSNANGCCCCCCCCCRLLFLRARRVDNTSTPLFCSSGPFQSGNDVTLQPGNFSFPFQFPLPPHSLPTSFEGTYGSVRYWIHAVADRPWRTNLQFDSPLFIVERVQIRDPALLVSERLDWKTQVISRVNEKLDSN